MKYSVYDNGKPASVIGFPNLVHKGWDDHSFDTFAEAHTYADKWLDDYATTLIVNVPYDYSGYGDMIEIREEHS